MQAKRHDYNDMQPTAIDEMPTEHDLPDPTYAYGGGGAHFTVKDDKTNQAYRITVTPKELIEALTDLKRIGALPPDRLVI